MKEKHHWITNSLVEHLNQLYLRWSAADATKVEEFHDMMKESVNKFMDDLNEAERDILRKTPPDTTPPPSPTLSNFSNPLQKQLAFKKRDPPKFSSEARDYPRFKKLWKAVVDQFDDTNQLQLVLDCTQVCPIQGEDLPDYERCLELDQAGERLWPDEVALALLDGFAKLTLTHKSEHNNFIQLFDKFEETPHDLTEIELSS